MEPNKRPSLPTIDQLKAYGVDPHWFGLGFFQLKINDNERYHFYHPEWRLAVPPEEVHNHRYEFVSTVLAGALTNHIFAFVDGEGTGTHRQVLVTCKEGEDPEFAASGWVAHLASMTMEMGSVYKMSPTTFHTVEADFAITHLRRGSARSERATVLRRLGSDGVCPFAHKVSVKDIWGYIEECLKWATFDAEARSPKAVDSRVPNPAQIAAMKKGFDEGVPNPRLLGYHLKEIPKGVLGEPSKIVEEALELLDAWEQDSIIMEQVELSDLYGAIESYIDKRHPNLEMDDVVRFSNITKRAFRNGRR